MSDIGGATELQLLEQEVATLKQQLASAEKAGKTGSACTRCVTSITEADDKDGFLAKEGAVEANAYHSSAAGGEGGCCVVH
jgi:hypothetical protein